MRAAVREHRDGPVLGQGAAQQFGGEAVGDLLQAAVGPGLPGAGARHRVGCAFARGADEARDAVRRGMVDGRAAQSADRLVGM
ncbi:hypothetical protein ADK53_29370 [Streptomyces sp. WM6373]|nr:hypothetical protein VR43_21910 [Streptomyces sp. NRRL S-104]KOU30299.1 hypothetical protein ADK53_29370 [Streptomyces sp. WM6373]KOU63617.1 hypothetical protein ADK96_24155 [Streptomyces sp. IGB124]KOV15866.1 hypothetical protein ADK90_30170 [Streptomyces sp. XY413]